MFDLIIAHGKALKKKKKKERVKKLEAKHRLFQTNLCRLVLISLFKYWCYS